MITPRTVRLIRTPSLHAYQAAIAACACDGDLSDVRSTAVLVPTRAAAEQLQLTIAGERLAGSRAALVLPDVLTRSDFYERLRSALVSPPAALSPFDRDVMLQAGAHEAITDGAVPPFILRPALIGEMLDLYDELRRRQKTLDDFERLLVEELEPRAPVDRGAERMLRQTRFLAAAFRSYERRARDATALDEHGLRERLLGGGHRRRYRRVVLAIGDRAMETGGLWPADFDLLSRIDGIESVAIVVTEAQLEAGFHERVRELMPGLEEQRIDADEPPFDARVLLVPGSRDPLHFVSRDREDEVAGVVRRIKSRRRAMPLDAARLDRTAMVFIRPLPYLYTARAAFEDAAVPYQCNDALPLAAEPPAAALDILLSFVVTGASRAATIALLRSPHFDLAAADEPLTMETVAALDRALGEARYAADPQRLAGWAAEWSPDYATADPRVAELRRRAGPAARAAAAALGELAPLLDTAPASVHIEALRRFWLRRSRPPTGDDKLHERTARARTAITTALDGLVAAHRAHGDLNYTIDDTAASVRRWLEGQTFSPRSGSTGVHLVDATSARFGSFDDVHLVGLVEGEWPERPRRNLFYSPFLLRRLGWSDDGARAAAARAAFLDLLRLAARRTAVSAFQLEEDSLVDPSSLLDDIPRAGLPAQPVASDDTPVFATEALLSSAPAAGIVSEDAERWILLRQVRRPASEPLYHGTARPHRPRTHGVGSVDTWVQCPFKYFARYVLRLPEETEEDEGLTPRSRGIVIHEVFHAFFEAWQQARRGNITPALLPDARAMLEAVMTPHLERLSPADAALERTRLLGSPVAPGLADLVLRMEAERSVTVVGRRLEDRFDAVFAFDGGDGVRQVPVRGIVDRIDLLGDGTIRVVDYKSSVPLQPMQLAIYAVTALERLRGHHGREWTLGEACYIVFNGAGVRPLGRGPAERAARLAEAQARFVTAVDQIEAGRFPPRPAQGHLCATCAYASVCRKDYVAEAEPDAAAAV